MPFRVFDKIQTVTPAAIVENKRLGASLAMVKEHQALTPISVVTTRRGNARRTIWKHQACRRRGGRGGVSCQASPRRPMDARWLSTLSWARVRASRAALRAPAGRLWRLTPRPSPKRLVDMPFRHGCVRQTEGVMSTLRTE